MDMILQTLRQLFCRHAYDLLYEYPKEGEVGVPDNMGLLLSNEMICIKCYKVHKGLLSKRNHYD